MKICVVLHKPYDVDTRVVRSTETLLKLGNKVTVLGIKKQRTTKEHLIKRSKNLTIKEFNIPSTLYCESIRKTLIDGNLVNIKLKDAIASEDCDVIYAHDLPTLEAAAKGAGKKKIPFLYDAHEIYLEKLKSTVKNETLINKIKILIIFFRFWLVEKIYAKKAFRFITVNPFIERYYQKEYKLTNTVTILNTPQKSLLNNEGIKLRKKLGIKPNEYIVAYHGALAKIRGVLDLAQAANYLPDGMHILIIGYGSSWDEIRNYSIKYNRKNLHLLPKIPPDKIVSSLREINLNVIPVYNINLSHYLCGPNKLFESLLASVPVLVPNYPFLKKIIEETKMGMVFDGEINPENLARNIRYFFEKRSRYIPKNFVSPYIWEKDEKKLVEIFNDLDKNLNSNSN